MKERKPTKRDIAKILGRRVGGWNDKRTDHNRIKLNERLPFNTMMRLESELNCMFEDYNFCVGDVIWKSHFGGKQVVTAVRYWKRGTPV
jgi:hypothetical protein